MSLRYDEYGNPFILITEQENKKRVRGREAIKSNILALKTLSSSLKTSLGPKGMDKVLLSSKNELTVTNDGATILDKMEVQNEVCKLLVSMSSSQDKQIGDGTTSVVLLASKLLEKAESLLDKNVHPLKISEGLDEACGIALAKLNSISDHLFFNQRNKEQLIKIAMTALQSKCVSGHGRHLAELVVDAVYSVADVERKDVNFDYVQIVTRTGSTLRDSKLIDGVVIDKEMSHSQMQKSVSPLKVLLLACALEPPRPKTKHTLAVNSAADYAELSAYEKSTFENIMRTIKKTGANVVLCQWGFDDEANYLLAKNGVSAVRWVGGTELELCAMVTDAQIVHRLSDASSSKLGKGHSIEEQSLGEEKITVLRGGNKRVQTILLRGGNAYVLDEAKRAVNDAMCCVRNAIMDNRVVYGGGSSEIACALEIERSMEGRPGYVQAAMGCFAEALEYIPLQLAENSGLSAFETFSEIKSKQFVGQNPLLGIDCNVSGNADMKQQGVVETLSSKRNQLLLATQLAKTVLKIDDMIVSRK